VSGCGCGRPACTGDHEGLSETPPLDELFQIEPAVEAAPATPVNLAGPAAVNLLPTVWGGARTLSVPAPAAGVVGQKVAGADPRRAALVLAVVGAAGAAVLLAGTRSGVELGKGFTLAVEHGAVRLTMDGEVFVAGVTGAAGPVSLSVLTEQWSR
jgi:hypothetical protein